MTNFGQAQITAENQRCSRNWRSTRRGEGSCRRVSCSRRGGSWRNKKEDLLLSHLLALTFLTIFGHWNKNDMFSSSLKRVENSFWKCSSVQHKHWQPQLAIHCHKSSPALVAQLYGQCVTALSDWLQAGPDLCGLKELEIVTICCCNWQLALPNGGAGFAASLHCVVSVHWDSVLVRPTMRRIVNVYAVF